MNSQKKNLLENEIITSKNFLLNKNNELENGNNNLNNFIHFDQVFDLIKQYGRYQFFMFLCIQYLMLTSVGNYIFMSFGTLRIQCKKNLEIVIFKF